MERASLNQNSPTDISASDHSTNGGTALYFQACTLHQQGDLSGAEEFYRKAVQADPTLHSAWRNLGALLRLQGHTKEARHFTDQALRLDSSDGSRGNYGNVLRDRSPGRIV